MNFKILSLFVFLAVCSIVFGHDGKRPRPTRDGSMTHPPRPTGVSRSNHDSHERPQSREPRSLDSDEHRDRPTGIFSHPPRPTGVSSRPSRPNKGSHERPFSRLPRSAESEEKNQRPRPTGTRPPKPTRVNSRPSRPNHNSHEIQTTQQAN